MKKSFLALTVLATLTISFIACNKARITDSEKDSPVVREVQTISGNSDTMYHNEIMGAMRAKYGTKDTTFYEYLRQSAEAAEDIPGFGQGFDPVDAAQQLNAYAQSGGLLDAQGYLKEESAYIAAAISHVEYPALRNFYTTVISEHGSGSIYCLALKARIDNFLLENTDIPAEPVEGFGRVYTESDVFGTPLPNDDIQGADAIGFQEGWNYSKATGGGINNHGHAPPLDGSAMSYLKRHLYWGMIVAAAASQAVACNNPNAH